MKKIGIIGAMEAEVETLKKEMVCERTVARAGMNFMEGTLEGVPVVIVRSGIGKVNAAACTQILADEFAVDAIINTGVAGSLKAEIDIGDIVLSTDVLHHDMDARGVGCPLGQIPDMDVFSFEADGELRSLAKEVCEKVNPDIKVFEGRVVSGDQFVSAKETKERIAANFQGYCTEMEGAAIAQVSYLNQIPFLIIRAISDKADDSASMTYSTFVTKAAEHSVRLVKGLLTRSRS